ncbi:esterase [Alloscardovia macacae]|uniref:Esterase n=1 Tax=Alloscardovia macacae TaxID=1160091 RepID=A0A1Y2SZK4_9BIFI|nr:esterase [Alloscardovia macacae]OTA25982.1 esterase [Alloscardovia macacae]OTA28749.1 esterase [Alloscardovia macacae]
MNHTPLEPGRKAIAVSGHYGDELRVSEALFSRGRGLNNPRRPLFVLLHGWGSNEEDIAEFFGNYVSPHSDYVSLRAPLTLLDPNDMDPFDDPDFAACSTAPSYVPAPVTGAYTWFHEAVPSGEDLDRDIYAAAVAIDNWVADFIPEEREVVPFGFSQGGALAVHLMRLNPHRYKAAACLSGFLAPGIVEGSHPGDATFQMLSPSVFYGYGLKDDMIPRFESNSLAAFLEEYSFLKLCEYRTLDHAVSLDECNDLRQWLMDIGASSGVM